MLKKRIDPVEVQVSFKVRTPRGVRVTREVLDKVYERWLDTGDLPRSVDIRLIAWRNPSRLGSLSDWRWSEGSDVSGIDSGGAGIEQSPRGSHEDARYTLMGLLRETRPSFKT